MVSEEMIANLHFLQSTKQYGEILNITKKILRTTGENSTECTSSVVFFYRGLAFQERAVIEQRKLENLQVAYIGAEIADFGVRDAIRNYLLSIKFGF